MNGVAQALIACIATGAVFTSMCAALAVPTVAWFAVRALAPQIRQMNGDPSGQSVFAAFAASIPGLLFLILVGYGIVTSISSACLQTLPGRVLFGALASLMFAAISRAFARAVARHGEAVQLTADRRPACARLTRIAASARVAAYEIADESRAVVMLFGSKMFGRKPAVYVSTRALRDLSDSELLAALHHEAAHQRRGDHRIAPLLYFFADLLPLPVGDLVLLYRRSREFCADQCAVRHVAPAELAAALLRMVHPLTKSVAHAAGLAEHDTVYDRLNVLLRNTDPQQPRLLHRIALTASLLAIVAMGAFTPQVAQLFFHCSRMGLSG